MAQSLGERKEESSQAAVNVQTDIIPDRQFTHTSDIVDYSLWVLRRRPVQHDGVGADGSMQRSHVALEGVLVHRDLYEADAQQTASLVDCRVCRLTRHNFWLRDPIVRAVELAMGLGSQHDGLRAPGGGGSDRNTETDTVNDNV